jgi:phage shock protein A
MFKRIWRYLKALITGKLDKWEDPELIINEAVREMKENQIKNRERAVQAITQKNNLQNLVAQEEKAVRQLEAKAALALQQGNRELARTLLREKQIKEQTLDQLRASLKQAEETSEAVKLAIKREEERIRVKTAEALALKANMKQAQIQIEINKALDGMQMDDTTQSWDRAEERIKTMQSEAAARAEVAKTGINSRLMELEESSMDAEAEKELQEMEARLGIGGTAATSTSQRQTTGQTAGATEDDIDKQLRELEQRLNQR